MSRVPDEPYRVSPRLDRVRSYPSAIQRLAKRRRRPPMPQHSAGNPAARGEVAVTASSRRRRRDESATRNASGRERLPGVWAHTRRPKAGPVCVGSPLASPGVPGSSELTATGARAASAPPPPFSAAVVQSPDGCSRRRGARRNGRDLQRTQTARTGIMVGRGLAVRESAARLGGRRCARLHSRLRSGLGGSSGLTSTSLARWPNSTGCSRARWPR